MSGHSTPHAMGIESETKRDLLTRLARARGQVEGLSRMIEEERYCPEILQQFAAVRAGLQAAEKKLFVNHLEGCATHAIVEGGEAAETAREELVDLFYRHMR